MKDSITICDKCGTITECQTMELYGPEDEAFIMLDAYELCSECAKKVTKYIYNIKQD